MHISCARHPRLLIMAMTVVIAGSSVALGDDWPRWRGSRGDGFSHETGLMDKWPEDLKALWSVDAIGQGYAGPAVSNGRVYLFSLINGNDTLTCYDADRGKEIWKQSYEGGWTGGYPGTRCTPYIEGDRIYTFGGMGELTARELATGKEIWRTNIVKVAGGQITGWAAASNPLIDGDRIYVQGCGNARIALGFDKHTGDLVWRSQAKGNGGYAHPIMADVQGKKQLIVFGAEGPYGIDPGNGRTIWHKSWQNSTNVSAADPIYRDGYLFISSAYGSGTSMYRLSPGGAQKVWENKTIEDRIQPAILDGDHLYINSEGTLTCVQWPDGIVKWRSDKKEKNLLGIGGTMIRVDKDKMILFSQSGRLTLAKVTPEGYQRLSNVPDFVDGSELFAMPAVADGKLFLRGNTELVCVKIKAD